MKSGLKLMLVALLSFCLVFSAASSASAAVPAVAYKAAKAYLKALKKYAEHEMKGVAEDYALNAEGQLELMDKYVDVIRQTGEKHRGTNTAKPTKEIDIMQANYEKSKRVTVAGLNEFKKSAGYFFVKKKAKERLNQFIKDINADNTSLHAIYDEARG